VTSNDVNNHPVFSYTSPQNAGVKQLLQESRAVATKPRDAAAVLFGSKFKSSQASKARPGFRAPDIYIYYEIVLGVQANN